MELKKSSKPSKIIIGLTVGVFALAVEFSLRIIGLGQPLLYVQVGTGYMVAPMQKIRRFGHFSRYNSFGMRGPETTDDAEVGIRRILVVGDSVSNGGTMIDDAQTFPAILEGLLKSAGRSAEVLNMSVGGWAVSNAAEWMRNRGLYGSHDVLMEINEDDLDQRYAAASVLDSNPSFPSERSWTATSELISRYVLPRILNTSTEDPGSIEKAFDNYAADLVLLDVKGTAELVSARCATLTVLYWDTLRPRAGAEVSRARLRLFQLLEEKRVHVIRPRIGIDDQMAESLYRDRIHPNVAGNNLIAERISAYYENRGPITGQCS